MKFMSIKRFNLPRIIGLSSLVLIVIFVGLFIPSSANSAAPQPPYPPSQVIQDITWDFSSRVQTAHGSDLWPSTWADDSNIYTVWGDGAGFGGGTSNGKVTLGVAQISGSPQNFATSNIFGGINSQAPATFPGKSHGIVSIDGTLYILVTEQDAWMRAKFGKSTDYGKTWTFDNGSFADSGWIFDEPNGAFASSAILQFGKDYQGPHNGYVYLYSEKERMTVQPHIVMARVPKNQIMDRQAYDFFAGLDNGDPQWSPDIDDMQPVFSDPNGVDWGMEVSYNPYIDRYLLTARRDRTGGWGIFDAPEPWGPWTTVAYYDGWLNSEDKQIMYSFPTKWMSADGSSMYMVFSSEDSFNLIKGTLTTSGSTPAPTPTHTPAPTFTPTPTHTPTPILSSGCPILPGISAQSQDLDSDGQCEDINGNGHMDFDDIVEFFLYLGSSPQQNTAELDFNGTQSQDMADVVTLFDILMDLRLQS